MDSKQITNQVRAYFAQRQMTMAQVAERLGVTPPAVTNQLNGRAFSAKMAHKYADEFGFDVEYLLTGKGALFAPENAVTDTASDTVPIVPYAVRGGALQGFSEGVEEWECERITSPVRGAELAFEVTGDSMAPGFPAGARVLLKRVKSVIAWGEVHVIDTVDGPVLKRIDQGENGTFILRSDNPAYQPIVVTRDEIRGVWRVLLRMIQ